MVSLYHKWWFCIWGFKMITKTRIIKLKNKEMDLINSKIQSGAKVTPEELNLLWNSFLIESKGGIR